MIKATPISDFQWFLVRRCARVFVIAHLKTPLSRDDFINMVEIVARDHPSLIAHINEQQECLHPISFNELVDQLKYKHVNDLIPSFADEVEFIQCLAGHESGSLLSGRCYVDPVRSETLLVFSAMHAAIEGVDFAQLLRQSDFSFPDVTLPDPPAPTSRLKKLVFLPLAISHLVRCLLTPPAPKDVILRHLTASRSSVRKLARQFNFDQTALLYGLVKHAVDRHLAYHGAGPDDFRTIATIFYSPKRMRSRKDRLGYGIRHVRVPLSQSWQQAVLSFQSPAEEVQYRPPWMFRPEILGWHRWLSQKLPVLYGERFFNRPPFQEAYNMMPPLRGEGAFSTYGGSQVLCGSVQTNNNHFSFYPSDDYFYISCNLKAQSIDIYWRILEVFTEVGIVLEPPEISQRSQIAARNT